MRRSFAAVRAASALLSDSDEESDGFALGFVPDHYLTEYHHPASAVRAEQVADLERFRGMGVDEAREAVAAQAQLVRRPIPGR